MSISFNFSPCCLSSPPKREDREGAREGGREGAAYRAVAPAEHAAVGAGQGRSHLHALVGGDAVEGVLVAAASTTELVFGPTREGGREGGMSG